MQTNTELVLHARVCVCVCQTYIAAVADARYQLILFFEESYGLHFAACLHKSVEISALKMNYVTTARSIGMIICCAVS